MGRLTGAIGVAAAAISFSACGDSAEETTSEGDTTPAATAQPAELGFYDWSSSVIPNPKAPASTPPTEAGFDSRSDAEEFLGEQSGETVIVAEGGTYFVIRDQPSLTGEDIADPELGTDPVTNQPNIAFQFTPAGEAKFEALTAEVARQGTKARGPGEPCSTSPPAGQFAIVLDEEVLSRPIIDCDSSPNGIDGSNGAQITGIGTVEETQAVAESLGAG